ncbi:MAG: maltose alpha-D-glucosyltransferase, partial [Gemmataceae bacterium]|nr:maltose alpha-D-glucosyltransferase [Gemmataceae bacterium]
MANDPLWYKDAVIYELHVRAFHDSVGDGVGDFKGLAAKLDYLADLGVTALWLLPFYPSPLRDDGYDIADYTAVHPNYGRVADFKEFLDEAHQRGLRVITELVINHTSDQHPWFQRARHAAKGSPERDFYVWSDTGTEYADARIIFKDFEPSNWTYDHVAKAYFWHRFYSHQPDLNFDNPAVWEALFPVMDFWLAMGVDGMRLDAIPYLYEREGTNCENLPETHVFLKALRKRMDEKWPGRMFLAEANQWPEDAVAYFGDGDECHMSFHFPLMPRLFMAVRQEDRFPILDILAQTPAIPDNCQWCVFLRNHDELTLEMVTDEERDYMYRAYASDRTARINLGIRRRLAPLLGNDRRRIELMNALLFSLPGTPVLYYGDEIGMGDNIYLGDRNGVRTPMQWSSDRNAGFSRGNPQSLYLPVVLDPEYRYEVVNVENQQNNPSSLLWWMKRLIAQRKQHQAFSRGAIEFLSPSNTRILAFIRRHGAERVLVVANLSRFVQHVELDLREHRGLVPDEMFGGSDFPAIGDGPYPLTLGPHAFYWLSLRPVPAADAASPDEALLPVLAEPTLAAAFVGPGRDRIEAALPAHLGGAVRSANIADAVRLEEGPASAWLTV